MMLIQNLKLKIYILTIIFCGFFGVAEKSEAANWYVDKDATGANDGLVWTSAWESFSDINWNYMQPGDTVYISGGFAEKIYTEKWTVGKSGTLANPIVIRPGQEAGHNGKVIFDYDQYGDEGSGYGITISYRSYVTFDGNVNGNNHLIIKNLRNILDRTNALCMAGYGDGASNPMRSIIIDHVDFENCNMGLRVWNFAENFEVKNSNFYQIRGDAAVAIFGSMDSFWDANLVHDNYIELLFNNIEPPGVLFSYAGPDGIQSSSGISVYNNIVKVNRTSEYTSTQHPDDMQITGNYVKVYNNDFINVGDSVFDFDTYSNTTPHDILIYNNTFRIVDNIDSYPEYIRMYSNSGNVLSFSNIKIFNNTFVDNNNFFLPIRMSFGGANPVISGFEIKNNIFYNMGSSDSRQVIVVPTSSGISGGSFAFEKNLYFTSGGAPYISFDGINYNISEWISSHEPTGITEAPTFVQYAPFDIDNNFHLASSDTAAKDSGVDLSVYFTTDKVSVSRPQGSAWDIGAYEYIESGDTIAPSAPGGLSVN